MANGPVEPNADMRALAAALWQMFNALLLEGFNERQSVAIIGQAMAANAANPNEEDGK